MDPALGELAGDILVDDGNIEAVAPGLNAPAAETVDASGMIVIPVIAVTSKERWRAWPNIPTLAETVLPGFDVSGWSALLAPARLPPAIVARLNEAARLAMKRPDVAEKFRAKGSDAVATDPEFARKFVAGEVGRWRRVIKEAGIPPQN
jgi:tripartite-type tricarboxylate transporter receptor subunit TctC